MKIKMLNFKALPNKLFDVCDFRKDENGNCILYNYAFKPEDRDVIIVNTQTDFEIPHDFKVLSKAVEATNKLDDGVTLEIKIGDNGFQAKSKKGHFKGNLINLENFSPLNEIYTHKLQSNINHLAKACEYVAVKSNRPILRGVHIDINGNIVASDSFRVYMNKVGEFSNEGITIPPAFIKVVKENFTDSDIVTLEFSQYRIKASNENLSIIGSLYEGTYPNLQKILDSGTAQTLNVIKKSELSEALEYIKFLNSESKDIQNYVIFKNNNLYLRGKETSFEKEFDLGLAENETICLQASYIIDALKSFDSDEITCQSATGTPKTLFTLEQGNENVLLMCIRLEE